MTGFKLPGYKPTTRRTHIKAALASRQAMRDPGNATYRGGGRPLSIGVPFKTCQFINGDPVDRDFCGEPVTGQSSYCAEHHAKCWFHPDPQRSYLVRKAGA